MRFTTNDIFTLKISYFLRVFKYDFSQWPKTVYNTYVYIIKCITVTILCKNTNNSYGIYFQCLLIYSTGIY
jgi:hypothetical protein